MRQLKLTKGAIDRGAKRGTAKTDLLYWDTEPKGFSLRVTPTGKATFIVQGRVGGSAKEARITVGAYGVFTVDQARDVGDQCGALFQSLASRRAVRGAAAERGLGRSGLTEERSIRAEAAAWRAGPTH